jgi:hypothetical protein
MKSDPRSDAAKRMLEDSKDGYEEEDVDEEGKPRKRTLMDELNDIDIGGAGLDEAPSDPREYGIGEE